MGDSRGGGDELLAYKGPRRLISARVSDECVLLLEMAAASAGMARSVYLADLLERYINDWSRAHLEEMEAFRDLLEEDDVG